MAKQLHFSEKLGASSRFGVNEPEKFVERFGWSGLATQPGEVDSARWYFPTVPRRIPDMPRIFFVEARRASGSALGGDQRREQKALPDKARSQPRTSATDAVVGPQDHTGIMSH
jgi:hypothetical protein